MCGRGEFPKGETVMERMRCVQRPPRNKGRVIEILEGGGVRGFDVTVAGCRFLLGAWKAVLWFPMNIRCCIGRGGRPDVRFQALQFLAFSGESDNSSIAQSVSLNDRRFSRNVRRSITCASRVLGIAAIHLFLPTVAPILERVLCLTGFVTGPLSALILQKGKSETDSVAADATQLIGWREFSIAGFLMQIAEQMSLPFCICRGIKEAWSHGYPDSYFLVDCSIALMEVDRSYKRLNRRIARGKIQGSDAIDKAWLELHKRSAQRLAHFMKDLPDTPPLKPLIEFWQRNGVVLGHFIDEQSLPVHCLADRVGFGLVLQVPSRLRRTRRHHVALQALARSSVHLPVAELCEYPLEIEMDMAAGDGGELEKVGPLYGRRGDGARDDGPLTVKESMALSIRAAELVFAFLPFLLLGLLLLVIAYSLETRPRSSSKKTETVEHYSMAEWRRSCVNGLRTFAFYRLFQGCREAGAAFIKFGQWSATRQDLFPSEFSDAMSSLHNQAPTHSIRHTREEIFKAFGRSVEEIFTYFDPEPLASGSVAQIHRATYSKDGQPISVVVKVRHPDVDRQISQDFKILKPLANGAERLAPLKNLPLKQSLLQFSENMTAQTDLRIEAAHLRRFGNNFASVNDAIIIPQIIPELVSEAVLVETFEDGVSVQHFINNPTPLNTKIVSLGVDAYLKMLLADNFIHTDLHPGNIMVRGGEDENPVQIVLLDFGLAEEIRPEIRHHFISFLNLIAKGDGGHAALHLLKWSQRQECPNRAAFIDDMRRLFEKECEIQSEEGIDLEVVLKAVLCVVRNHSVSIDSVYASLVIGACMIVGFAKSLDPRVNLMDAATPVLLNYALTGRVVGRLYG